MEKIYLTAWVDDIPEIHVAHELNKTSKELIFSKIEQLQSSIANRIHCKKTDNLDFQQFWDIEIAMMKNEIEMYVKLLIEY